MEERKNTKNPNRNKDGEKPAEKENDGFEDKLVLINRVAKVVKGGRRFSFSVLVVSGDHNGSVGCGLGKANEVPEAIRKATENARRKMNKVGIYNKSIPYRVLGKYGSAKVLLMPAPEGTGIIAGGSVRSVLEVAGFENVRAKVHGTNNAHNVVKATLSGLKMLKLPSEYAKQFGKEVNEII